MTYAVSKISAESPDMSDSEFAEFVADIQKNGQLVPIWIRGAEIIDGRKRFAACTKLGIKPKVVNLDPQQDSDAIARALNVLRTHYTIGQRALYAARRPSLTRGHVASQMVTEFRDQKPIVQRQAAREAGISPDSITVANAILREGATEVVAAVERGSLTLNAAEQIVKAIPKAEQPSVVARVVADSAVSTPKSRKTPTGKVLNGGEDVRRHRAIRAKPDAAFARSIQMLEVAVDVLMTNAPLVTRDFRKAEWLEKLSESRTTITHIIKALEK